ncbi:bifunctional phosphopantothenoylcysteine decarboxylase/phosphopantothenate--cysteine ligase CoaBC [Kocuria sp. cx-116]|uniref:bifunctional phosphopantothenoylcysteine decarboxylase/phosphopantothenate--cysteine ligase CoaBC n=1 Tax=Kocuria sp. cx-116 TaxID=2771378 RepID=UPI002A4E1693|nr:bifunctional phosphopantothenoylcysteine decarboxylase/phosphopantothenate--cysteine ligase CoaBC [Kocuria sp. cx-116]
MTVPDASGAPVRSRSAAPLRVVLGVGGGIAAYKAALLTRLFTEAGHRVVPMPTAAALEFVGAPTWEALTGEPVSTCVFDRVDTVNHVAQGQHADLVVVAPATADLMAKIAHGHADDLLTTTILASRAPIVLAPAMHTEMWFNPATQRNVALLREHGHTVIDPDSGRLTGRDSGPGRLPEPRAIYDAALAVHARGAAASSGPLAGRRVLVTAGGTREPLDPVRFLGNRSSGKQGIALAEAARDAGATVELIVGHVETELPRGVEISQISSAVQLHEATRTAAQNADVVIMAAAVADYRPVSVGEHKMKKSEDGTNPVIELTRNPDILRGVVEDRTANAREQLIVGFAAETGDGEHSVLDFGRVKLHRKGCDLLVVNQVGTSKVFGQDTTEVTVLSAKGAEDAHASGSKAEVAQFIMDRVGVELGLRSDG